MTHNFPVLNAAYAAALQTRPIKLRQLLGNIRYIVSHKLVRWRKD